MNKIKLGSVIETLTDYHANGSYEILKKNVSLKENEDHALMVRTTNFEQDDFVNTVRFIDKQSYNFLKKTKVFAGDIIMNKIANAGSVYLMPDLNRPVSLAMNLFLIRPNKNKVNPKYVYLFLKINERYVKSFSQGSVTKTITKDAVRNLEFFLPDRKVQDDIIKIFEIINSKIENNKKIKKKLEEITKEIFKFLFIKFEPLKVKMNSRSEKISNEIINLFPNSFTDSDMGKIPTGWKVKKINDIADFQNGYNFKSKEYVNKEEGCLEVFRMGYINRGGGFKEDKSTVFSSKLSKGNQEKYHLSKKDITIAMTDMKDKMVILGCCALIEEDNRFILNQRVGRIRVKDSSLVDPLYLFMFMNYPTNVNLIRSKSNSGVQVNLSTDTIKETQVLIPSKEIMNVFRKYTKHAFDKIFIKNLEIKKLYNLRDTLLPKLISGDLTIPDTAKFTDETCI